MWLSRQGAGQVSGLVARWPSMFAALLGGGVHALSLSPWVAQMAVWMPALSQSLSLLLLVWGLRRLVRPAHGAWAAWLYGSTWLIGATGWMYVSLHQFGGLPAWLSALAVWLLCAALSGYMALLGGVWVRWRAGVWWRDGLLFGASWALAEVARALIFTGFPWGASGYGLIDSPVVSLAPWLGVYGMGLVWATVLSAAICFVLASPGVGRLGAVVAALAMMLFGLSLTGSMSFTQAAGKPLHVTLLQGNVPQDEKFAPTHQLSMLVWHARQLMDAPGDLVVAPETAIPLLPSQLPEAFWGQIAASFGAGSGRAALVGVPLGDFDAGYTNSVAGLSEQAMRSREGMYRYDKHHLVPFGEFIPVGFHWFVRMMNMPLGDFSRGPLVAPSFEVKGQRVAPTICYEDLFGEDIAARFVDEVHAPTMLANVSNLAWFGESVAIHQHLQIARMRSLEFQIPTVRATNTGATVVIDHQGRVTASLPANTRGRLLADVQGRQGVTPYAWWAGRWGLWPLIGLAILMSWLGAGGKRRPHPLDAGIS